jgi:hypothetical protein
MKKREFAKYRRARTEGASPADLYLMATADGLSWSECFRMLRVVCRLSPLEAKEVTVTASGEASSLNEYQARLAPALKRALEEFEDS